ncbi:glycosyltransferase [Desulfosarcina sp.]|uniref:glycosyltransferase n=1 Tax=Desulfosarcina sp. TaxID=2027861 RepID=UPI003970D7E4
MRVLCITNHSDRPEAETFIGLKQQGVNIQVLCPSTAPHFQRLQKAGVPVTDFKLSGRIDVRGIRFIRKVINDYRIDILHLFNNRAVSNGILAARHLSVKIIAYRGTVGNVSYFDPGSWMTYLNPRIDRIICVSEAVRQFFLQMDWMGLRLPAQKPVTVHKGHDLSWYAQPPGDIRQLGIPDGAFVVVCTGRFRPHKGIHILIEAMRYIPASLPIHLLLIGDMNTRPLHRLIRRDPHAERIHLAGYRTDAPALQAACDVAVLPALRREGLPKVVIEAMAYGVPPIVTDSGGSSELIEEGVSGLIVKSGESKALADAILSLYHNPEQRAAMGRKAQDRIGTCFRIETTIAKTLDIYADCLSRC